MQVKKLIAGPHVYICEECVTLCVEILTEELPGWGDKRLPVTPETAGQGITEAPVLQPTQAAATPAADTLVCSFCGQSPPPGTMVSGAGVYICHACTSRIQKVLAVTGGTASTPIGTIRQVNDEARTEQCGFCSRRRDQVSAMASAGNARICDGCLQVCLEVRQVHLAAIKGISTLLEVCSYRRERLRSLEEDAAFNRAVDELKQEGPEGAEALAALIDELLAARCAEISDVLAAARLLSPQPDLVDSVQKVISAPPVIVGQPGRFPPVIIGGGKIGWDDRAAAHIKEQASEVLVMLGAASEELR